jgi:hypothetical protein
VHRKMRGHVKGMLLLANLRPLKHQIMTVAAYELQNVGQHIVLT